MVDLDRTEQRIVGVLIEKQFSVPDSYPLSENALVDGCNQKNNREPVMELVSFQVAGALMALQQKGVVGKLDGAGRVAKFRHKLDEVLPATANEIAVLAELLLRGPQAPGALKPRVARMGYHASPEQIDEQLRQMASRKPPLVEQLPLAPRERDRRWRHLLGDGSELVADAGAAGPAATPRAMVDDDAIVPAAQSRTAGVDAVAELAERVRVLEQLVGKLQTDLQQLATRNR